MKNYEKAIFYYKRGVKISPFDSLLWFNIGTLLYELKNYEKAIECFFKVIEDNFQFY